MKIARCMAEIPERGGHSSPRLLRMESSKSGTIEIRANQSPESKAVGDTRV